MVDIDGVVFCTAGRAAACIPEDVVLEDARSARKVSESHRVVVSVDNRAADENAVEVVFPSTGILGLDAFHVLRRRNLVPCGIITQLDHVVGHNHVCISR